MEVCSRAETELQYKINYRHSVQADQGWTNTLKHLTNLPLTDVLHGQTADRTVKDSFRVKEKTVQSSLTIMRKCVSRALEGELTFTGVNAIDTAGTCWAIDLRSTWEKDTLAFRQRHYNTLTAARSHWKQDQRWTDMLAKMQTQLKFWHKLSAAPRSPATAQTLQSTQSSGRRDTKAVEDDSGEKDMRKLTVFT